MEIYRGLNIDISARQRRSEMSLNRNPESLCAYQKYAPKKIRIDYATIVYLATLRASNIKIFR